MTHILFLTPYYPPEKTAPAIRISETAQCLLRRGYQVTVLTTFPNFPAGIVPPRYRGQVIRREVREGVSIVRVWSYITPNRGFLKRMLAQLSFGCVAPLLGWGAVGRPDVIIVESPPLFDAIGGCLLAWGKRCPFIFTVADLWPEVAVQIGMLRNRLFIRLAQWLEWSTYRRASLVWAVTQGIRDTLIERGLIQEHVFLVTNGADIDRFRPLPRHQAREELGWNDCFTLLFAGTHGLVYSLITLLDAAEQLRGRPDIRFVLAGDGATKEHLMRQAEARHLENVVFLDPQPHERMPLLYAAADACVIPVRRVPMALATLPAKMFEIMACARPMLLGLDGEARRMVEGEAGAAIYVEPENPEALVSAILHLYAHPEEAEVLGGRARAFVEARFDREQLVSTLEGEIARILKQIPQDWSFEPSRSLLYSCWHVTLDIILALLGAAVILLTLPVMALLIYLDSPGPIFYSQERLGLHGRPFRIYKFRSMRTDAESGGQAIWATADDARVTRVGRVLRATHMDELPQVFNILRGEMSLIGPRPEREVYARQIEQIEPSYRYRLAVKPGLTGWAQVKFGYGEGDQGELQKLQYDLYYIQHRSSLFDISIIFKTLVEVFRFHGR